MRDEFQQSFRSRYPGVAAVGEVEVALSGAGGARGGDPGEMDDGTSGCSIWMGIERVFGSVNFAAHLFILGFSKGKRDTI